MSNPYAKQLKKIVFDIETTGLSPQSDMIISASFYDPDTEEMTQIFSESTEDEKRLVSEIYRILSYYNAVITYNGNRFDLPFIKYRAKKYGITTDTLFWSCDMYRYLKKYWPMAERMKHLNQASVEEVLGLSDNRDDEIGGAECVALYEHYLLAKDDESKRLILLHNGDDVRQLGRIYKAAKFLPYDKIAYEMGFGIPGSRFVLCNGIKIDKNSLYAEAITTAGSIPSAIYEDAYELLYDSLSGEIKLKINLSARRNMLYVDLKSLPCKIDDLRDLRGYFSDFLVLKEASEINYQEAAALISSILSSKALF